LIYSLIIRLFQNCWNACAIALKVKVLLEAIQSRKMVNEIGAERLAPDPNPVMAETGMRKLPMLAHAIFIFQLYATSEFES
jgi:hypothetical protein